ncbi:MAG: hypothetical protein ACREOG_22235, partial [Gemmatimonadaceae bacterium]
GQWIVSRWAIRMPQPVTEMQSLGLSARQVPFKRLARVVERGAFVSRVVFNGREFLEFGRQPLTLTIRSGDASFQPLVGTTIQLPAEERRWVVDTSAVIRAEHVLPGRHRFLVQTPLMRDLGLAPDVVDASIIPDTTELQATLFVPSTSGVRRRLCSGPDRDAVAAGALTAERVHALGAVYVSRASDVTDGAKPAARRTAAVVDSTGRWHACGLPRSTSLTLWAARDGVVQTLVRFRIPRGVDLALVGPTNANFAVAAALPPAPNEAVGARLIVRVLAARDSSPLLDAEAVLDDSLLARPNASGELRFSGQDVGPHQIMVRRLGYEPVVRSVELSLAEARVDTIYLDRLAQLLTEVKVRGRMVRVPLKYVDVLRRAASGWGTVFTREDIRGAYDLKSLLFKMPGVDVSDRGVIFARCSGEFQSGPQKNAKVQVYIDGVRITALPRRVIKPDNSRPSGMDDDVTDALRLVSPGEIEFMEVYRGVAQIPVEFLEDACAVIAIWTRAY